VAMIHCAHCGIPETGHRDGNFYTKESGSVWVCEKCDQKGESE